MKKIIIALGTLLCAFLFVFTFTISVSAAEEDDLVLDETTETVESEVVETEDLVVVETEEGKKELSPEAILEIANAIAAVSKGDFSSAYNTLTLYAGVAFAIVVIVILITLLFAVKYFKTSALLKVVQAKLDAQTNAKIDAFTDKVEAKLEAEINKIDLKFAAADSNKAAEAKKQIEALSEKLNAAKAKLE